MDACIFMFIIEISAFVDLKSYHDVYREFIYRMSKHVYWYVTFFFLSKFKLSFGVPKRGGNAV